jgi:hypothetical protein
LRNLRQQGGAHLDQPTHVPDRRLGHSLGTAAHLPDHLLAVCEQLLGLRNELMQERIFLLLGPGKQMLLFDYLEDRFRLLFPCLDRCHASLFHFHQAA